MKIQSVLIPLGLGVAVSAQAQTPLPYTFRIGYSALADKTGTFVTKFDGTTAGFGFDLSRIKSGLSLDLNYDYHTGSGARIESPSAMFSLRIPFSGMDSTGAQNYFGLGVGVMNSHVKYTVSGGSSTTTTTSSTKTSLGAEFLLGVNINPTTSIELYTRLSNKVAGVNPSTVGLVYAKHF